MATEAPDAERRAETAKFVVDTNKKDLEYDNNMADVLRGLQASLTKLATASEKQTVASEKQAAAIESLHDDIYLNTVDPTVEDDEHVGSEMSLRPTSPKVLAMTSVAQTSPKHRPTSPKVLAMTSVAVRDKETSQDSAVPDSGPQSEFLESLTQAFIPNVQKSPPIESKVA